MERRSFLKLLGIGVVAASTGVKINLDQASPMLNIQRRNVSFQPYKSDPLGQRGYVDAEFYIKDVVINGDLITNKG